MSEFMFATGIENSYPTIEWKERRIRQDELAKTQTLPVLARGFPAPEGTRNRISPVRPSVFLERTQVPDDMTGVSPTRRSARCKEQKVTPIADLCHFGVPDWIGNFQNGDWP